MRMTIKLRLIVLGVVVVAAFSIGSFLNYQNSIEVKGLNDLMRSSQANLILSDSWDYERMELLSNVYAAAREAESGAVSKERMDTMATSANNMIDIPGQLLSKHLSYLDDEKLKSAMEIGTQLVKTVKEDLPKLVAAHASADEINKLIVRVETGITQEGDIQNGAENAIKKELSDVSDEVVAKIDESIRIMEIIAVVTLVMLIPHLTIITVGIIRSLKQVRQSIDDLASGVKHEDASVTMRNDEIGDVMKALMHLQEVTAHKAKTEAQNEMDRKEMADAEKGKAMHRLADGFEASVKKIVSTVAAAATELAQTAEGLVKITSQTSQTVQNAASGANQTVANVQSVASAAEEMTASVKEISSQLQNSNMMVQDSVRKAESADAQASELSDATVKVKEVIEMISNIAGQINLLALNATIESARAGEAGKGFAVVASEVKNLAGQTDKSVQEIEKVIQEMNLASSGIIDSLRDIRVSIQNISGASSTIAAAVEEQSATTNEIANNMQMAAQATEAISGNLNQVASSSSEAESSSGQVLEASRELSRMAENLNREVEEFLQTVRAA